MDPFWRKRAVCRSLFGPVDHDQLRAELTLRLKEVTERDRRRWNFDFHTHTPLPGRFQWEEMPAGCAAPPHQERTPPTHDARPPSAEEGVGRSSREESSGADQENCSSVSNTSKCPAGGTPGRRKRTLPKATAKPRINARITDFFAKRRRTTESKSTQKHLHTSGAEGALCKTIR